MSDEISGEIKLLHDQFLSASKETTGTITALGQRFDAVFKQMGVSSDAGIAAVVSQLEKLDAKFAKTVQDAKGRADSLKFDKLAQGFQAIGEKAGGAFTGAIDGGQKYEAAINRVRAISGLGAADIAQLNKDIEEMGRKFGFAVGPTQTAEIALQALGSGFETVAESTKIAKSSLALIADGTTSATDATKLLVGTLNAYGQRADDAAEITDQLFQIQNRGVVTISEMSQTLGLVTKSAADAGVAFKEVGAAVIVATKNNLPFTSTVDGLRGLMANLQNPTDKAAQAMLKYGLSINYATLRQKGLGATLQEIKTAIGGDAAALKDIVGDQQAFALATALTSDNLKAFSVEVQGLEKATGAAANSTSIYAEGLENRTAAFAAAAERLKVSVTKDVLPLATAFVKFSTSAVDSLTALPGPAKMLGVVATGAAAALGLMAGASLFVATQLTVLNAALVTSGASSIPQMISGLGLMAKKMALTAAATVILEKSVVSFSFANLGIVGGLEALASTTILASAGVAILGAGVIALALAYKNATDDAAKYNDELSIANQGIREFKDATGNVRKVKLLDRTDALGSSAQDLVKRGFNADDLTATLQTARKRAEETDDKQVKEFFVEQVKELEKRRAEVAKLAQTATKVDQQQVIVTAQQEKEAYKDAFLRIQLSKDDALSKAAQLKNLIGRYRLVGDERRQVEQAVAQEEEKASKKAAQNEEKRRSESVKNQVQEVENSKKSTDEKIKDLKRILDIANLSGNERRAIEDKVLAHEKSLLAAREKIAERQKKIALEASEEKIKTAEHELEQLQKLADKGVDTTPQQVEQIKIRATEQKKQVDTKLEADLAKDKDPANQKDLRTNAKREVAEIERDAQRATTDAQEKGAQDRLQRQQQTVQQEIDLAKRRFEQLAKLNPKQGSFLLEMEAAKRLQLMTQEIELQKQLTQSQTKDPAQIAQAEVLAQQQVLDARIQVREEIEAATKAIEEQQKKSRPQSNEFSGNILSLDQFLQGEKDRFSTKTAEEFFGGGKSKSKFSNTPGISDFDLKAGLQQEMLRDPTRRALNGTGQGGSQVARPAPVEIRGEFRLIDAAGKEVGRLERLSVNGRNSDLASEARLLGV